MTVVATDARINRVGFAKLIGDNVNYIIRKYEVILGRKNKNKPIDVHLGDTMSVSRQHAKIFYDFTQGQFMLQVVGKNGIVVDGKLVEANNPPVPLVSQSCMQIGSDVLFYFVLPMKLSKVFRSAKRKSRSYDAAEMEAGDMSSGEQKQSGPMGEISTKLLQAHSDGFKRGKTDDEAMDGGESMYIDA